MANFQCANFDVSEAGEKHSVPEVYLVWTSQ